MGSRQWEYLSTVAREVGNINLAVLVIGQYVLEQGIDRSLFVWGILLSIGAYLVGFLITYLFNRE